MVQLGAWLVAAAITSVALRSRPVITVALALTLWTLLPAVAAHRVTGSISGPLAIHPATWLVVMQFAVCFVLDARPLVRGARRHAVLTVVASTFVVGALAASVLNGESGARMLGDQIIGPFVAFALIVGYCTITTPETNALRVLIVGLGVAESVFVVLQSALGRTLLFEADYARLYWFRPDRFDRWMGTTDHPLVLSVLISTAAILAIGLRTSTLVRAGVLVVLSLGAATTQSRIGVVVVGCTVIWFVVFSRINLIARVVCFAAAAVAARAILRSELVTGVSSRLSDDTGSTEARRRAIGFFFDNIDSVAWAGHGLTSSYEFARSGGLQTSLESSFMMYAVDVGLPLAVLYFGAQLALVLGSLPGNRIAGAAPAALVAVLIPHTFSGLGYSNMTGFLVWCVVGLTVVGSAQHSVEPEEVDDGARRSTSMSAVV